VRLSVTTQDVASQAQSSWVGLLYRDLLNRTPGANEVANWLVAMETGMPPTTVVSSIVHSPEYSKRLVTGWYQLHLLRQPDSGGLTNMVNALQNGAGEFGLRLGILNSAEDFNKHGANNQGFIQGLYREPLGRDPGQAEIDAWVQLIKNDNCVPVIQAILGSMEYRLRAVRSMYDDLLRRQADPTGLASFVGSLNQGAQERDVVVALASNGEYRQEAHDILWLKG